MKTFSHSPLVRGRTDGPRATKFRVGDIKFLCELFDISRALVQHLCIERLDRHDSIRNANTQHHRDDRFFIREGVRIDVDGHFAVDLAPIHFRIR